MLSCSDTWADKHIATWEQEQLSGRSYTFTEMNAAARRP